MYPTTIAVEDYDEELDESFHGPGFLEEEFYENEGYEEGDHDDEQTGAQGVALDATGPVLVSQYTQLGAVPGTPQAGVSGSRDHEPEVPPQLHTTTGEDKTIIEFASSGSATPLLNGAPFNPDGTPLEDAEALELMNCNACKEK